MNLKTVSIVFVIVLIVAAVGAFYAGTASAGTKTTTITAVSSQTSTVISTVTTPTTRTITDMLGRNLTVPTNIRRVLTTGPVEMELVYMLAPSKLAGLSFSYDGAPTPGEPLAPLVPANMSGLPVVGGWFGRQTGNFETFIGAQPDIILDGQHDQSGGATDINAFQQKFGDIPVVELNSSWDATVTGYTAAIRFVGNLLGVPQQATNLINYYQDAMNYVNGITSSIPSASRVKVYYAEGGNGLSTDPTGSMHTQLLSFCGGINVANVTLLPGYGMASVSPEQILLWNPDMILIGRGSQASLYHTVLSNTTWSSVNAVKDGKVYVRPDNPFSWFDGPPGPMQIVGMYWMVHILYPAQTSGLDLNGKITQFYTQFMHYSLNSTQLAEVDANPH